jgi:hypothetical protein
LDEVLAAKAHLFRRNLRGSIRGNILRVLDVENGVVGGEEDGGLRDERLDFGDKSSDLLSNSVNMIDL